MIDTREEIAFRRQNATDADDGTPEGRLYARLLHVQIDCQVEMDEEAEELLCEILDHWRGSLK